MAIRVTQLGNEVWVRNPSNIRVTQIGLEVWINPLSHIRVTQVGLEVWRSIATLPQVITGHADGYAIAYALGNAMPVAGHADGYATAVDLAYPPGSPIMVVMGI